MTSVMSGGHDATYDQWPRWCVLAYFAAMPFRRSGWRRGLRPGMQQIARFDRLDRHQEALAALAWNAGISAQFKIRTTARFDQGQPHRPAALQEWNLGGSKVGAGGRRHDAPFELGWSAMPSVTDGSRDRAAIGERYTFIGSADTFQFESGLRRSKSPAQPAGLFVLSSD